MKTRKEKRGSITCRTDRANEANKMFIIWLCWLFRFWKGDRELDVRTATYGPGIDQPQHAESVSHVIIVNSVIIIVVLRYRRGRSVLFFLLCTLSPKAEAQARPHTGQFTFLLGSDSLASLIARFLSSSVKRFCSNIFTSMCTAVLRLLRSSSITVQFEGEIPHRRNDR